MLSQQLAKLPLFDAGLLGAIVVGAYAAFIADEPPPIFFSALAGITVALALRYARRDSRCDSRISAASDTTNATSSSRWLNSAKSHSSRQQLRPRADSDVGPSTNIDFAAAPATSVLCTAGAGNHGGGGDGCNTGVSARAATTSIGTVSASASACAIESWLISHLKFAVNMRELDVDQSLLPSIPLARLGIGSQEGVALLAKLEEWINTDLIPRQPQPRRLQLRPTMLLEYPTIQALAVAIAHLVLANVQVDKVAGAKARVPAATLEMTPELECKTELQTSTGTSTEPIAVCGIGLRLPGGAHTAADFWRNLVDGRDTAQATPSAERRRLCGGMSESTCSVTREDAADRGDCLPGVQTRRPLPEPAQVCAHFLDDGVVSAFDAPFFGIGRHEATWIDPQHRLLLLCAVEACEDAMICGGIGALRHRGGGANGEQGTAVFMAIGASDYAHMAWNAFGQHSMRAGAHAGAGGGTFGAGAARLAEDAPALGVAVGCAHSMAACRISHALGLHGTALTVDAACAGGMHALILAAESLRGARCRAALVGGASLVLSPLLHGLLSSAGFLSPDGRCKAFARDADGYGRGEGAVAMLLMRQSEAKKCGARVYAMLRGTASGHNGGRAGAAGGLGTDLGMPPLDVINDTSSVGVDCAVGGTQLTAPSRAAQAQLLRNAHACLRTRGGQQSCGGLQYVEAHGTGTSLGDPLEALAIGDALAPLSDVCEGRKQLLVGSVKSNVGHLEAAAGLVGVAKVALALHRAWLPRTLHCEGQACSEILGNLGLDVVSSSQPWPASSSGSNEREAGVSSFGFGGANAHVRMTSTHATSATSNTKCVMDTNNSVANVSGHSACVETPLVLMLSAHSPSALRNLVLRYASALRGETPTGAKGALQSARQLFPPLAQHATDRICRAAATRRESRRFRVAIDIACSNNQDVGAKRNSTLAAGLEHAATLVQQCFDGSVQQETMCSVLSGSYSVNVDDSARMQWHQQRRRWQQKQQRLKLAPGTSLGVAFVFLDARIRPNELDGVMRVACAGDGPGLAFWNMVRRIDTCLRRWVNWSVLQLFENAATGHVPSGVGEGGKSHEMAPEASAAVLNPTPEMRVEQQSILAFTAQVALAAEWQARYGIVPCAYVASGVGEIAAALASGAVHMSYAVCAVALRSMMLAGTEVQVEAQQDHALPTIVESGQGSSIETYLWGRRVNVCDSSAPWCDVADASSFLAGSKEAIVDAEEISRAFEQELAMFANTADEDDSTCRANEIPVYSASTDGESLCEPSGAVDSDRYAQWRARWAHALRASLLALDRGEGVGLSHTARTCAEVRAATGTSTFLLFGSSGLGTGCDDNLLAAALSQSMHAAAAHYDTAADALPVITAYALRRHADANALKLPHWTGAGAALAKLFAAGYMLDLPRLFQPTVADIRAADAGVPLPLSSWDTAHYWLPSNLITSERAALVALPAQESSAKMPLEATMRQTYVQVECESRNDLASILCKLQLEAARLLGMLPAEAPADSHELSASVAHAVCPTVPLASLGIDSLMSVELTKWAQRQYFDAGTTKPGAFANLLVPGEIGDGSVAPTLDSIAKAVHCALNTPAQAIHVGAAKSAYPHVSAGMTTSMEYPASSFQQLCWRTDITNTFMLNGVCTRGRATTADLPVQLHSLWSSARAVRLCGPLDSDALDRALLELLRRHAALRTTLRWGGASRGLLAVVHSANDIANAVPGGKSPFFRMVRRSVCGDDANVQSLEDGMLEALAMPYAASDLSIRATLFDVGHDGTATQDSEENRNGGNHVLLLEFHHSIFDAWSLQTIITEIIALYSAQVGAPRPERAVTALLASGAHTKPFAQFAIEEQTVLTQALSAQAMVTTDTRVARAARSLRYFRDEIANGLPLVRSWQRHAPRGAIQRCRCAFHGHEIDTATTAAVRDFARSHGTTPFAALLAAFQLVSSRWTFAHPEDVHSVTKSAKSRTNTDASSDILVYSAFLVRDDVAFATVVGPLLNIIGLRGRLSDDPTLVTLLKRAGKSVVEAQSHSHVAFHEALGADLLFAGDRTSHHQENFLQFLFTMFSSDTPSFSQQQAEATDKSVVAERDAFAKFVLGSDGGTISVTQDLTASPFPVSTKYDFVDLTLFVAEVDGKFQASFRYNVEVLDDATVRSIAEEFAHVLNTMASLSSTNNDVPVPHISEIDIGHHKQ